MTASRVITISVRNSVEFGGSDAWVAQLSVRNSVEFGGVR